MAAHIIGYRGENLQALQHVLNQIVRNQSGGLAYVSIDVSGYKKARAEQVAVEAKKIAEQVLESGQTYKFKPMNPAERRVVHMTLAEIDGVTTESEGR